MKQVFQGATAVIAVLLAFLTIAFPQEVFQGAVRGLTTWFNIVLPALFPFFVISHLLLGLGVVHFLGVLLEPVMRPLFNVPGCGAFVVAMGYTSGAPIGSVLTADLRRQGLVTRLEGERLMAFTNNASPLFMIGAVAVGMLDNQALGASLAAGHYLTNLLLGLLLRFYGAKHSKGKSSYPGDGQTTTLSRAWRFMIATRQSDGRPLAQILGDAINQAFRILISIAGFIMIFAVLIQVLKALGIASLLERILDPFLGLLGMDHSLSQSLTNGFFEMTLGAQTASETTAPRNQQIMVIAMVMGWSGLSIHAQVASAISDTDLRLLPFVLTRLAHGLLAPLVTLFFMNRSVPVLLPLQTPVSGIQMALLSLVHLGGVFAFFIVLGIMLSLLRNTTIALWRHQS